ncbi:MAG: hypothetical protein AB7S77_10325 [Desulfatirhabdiaceae bacterium]
MSTVSDESPGCYTEHGVSGYGVAAKISHSEPMTEEFVKSMAEGMMLAIAAKCMELGAKCIGHIKSHLRTEAGTIKADTIGVGHGSYSSGQLTHPVRDVFIAINSIVQGIPEDAVKAATLEGMHEVAGQNGLFVVKEKEHTYFDEFDFTASKQDYIKQLTGQLEADKTE